MPEFVTYRAVRFTERDCTLAVDSDHHVAEPLTIQPLPNLVLDPCDPRNIVHHLELDGVKAAFQGVFFESDVELAGLQLSDDVGGCLRNVLLCCGQVGGGAGAFPTLGLLLQ